MSGCASHLWTASHGLPSGGGLLPSAAGLPGTFGEGGQFGIGDLGVDGAKTGKGSEPAIRAGHQPVRRNKFEKPLQPLRDHFRMFHEIRGAVDDAGDQYPVAGNLAEPVAEYSPFMRMARIRGFKQDGSSPVSDRLSTSTFFAAIPTNSSSDLS